MDILVLVYFLTSVACLWFVIYVLLADRQARLNQVAAALLGCLWLWNFSDIFWQSTTDPVQAMFWQNVSSIGWISYTSFAFWFVLIFIKQDRLLKNKLFVPAIFLIPALLIYKQWTGQLITGFVRQPYGWGNIWAGSFWSYLHFGYYLGLTLLCLILLGSYWRKAPDRNTRKQSEIMTIAALIAVAGGTLTDVILPSWRIWAVPPIAPVWTLVWVGGLVYAITRYRFLTMTLTDAAGDIVATMPDPLFLLDLGGQAVLVNQAAEKLTGYSAGEISQLHFQQILAETERSVSQDWVAKVVKSGQLPAREVLLRTKKGRYLSVLLSSTAVRSRIGEPIGIIILLHDLSEHRQVEEEKLRHTADLEFLSQAALGFIDLTPNEDIYHYIGERLQELVGDAYIAVNSFDARTGTATVRALFGLGKYLQRITELFGWDPLGRPIKLSEAAIKNYSTGKIIDIPGKMYELTMGTVPQPVCAIVEKMVGLESVRAIGLVKQGKMYGGAIIMTRRKGELPNQRLVEAFINLAGMALQRQQSEEALRQSEERFRDVAESTGDWIWEVDQDGRYTYSSPVSIRMLGYKPEEIVGTNFADHLLPAEKERIVQAARQIFERKDVFLNFSNEVVHRDGHVLTLETSGVPMLGPAGELLGYRGVDRDVTERRKLDRLKDEFISSVSHELRTPLSVIKEGIAQVSEGVRGEIKPEQQRPLALALENVERLNRIVGSLLDISKLEAGKVLLNKSYFDLVDLVRQIGQGYSELARKHQVILTKHLPGQQIQVWADKDKISEVLANLLNNAFKFAPAGQVTVSLAKNDREAEVSVSDTGPGIPKEMLPRVFSKFEQFNRRPGTGEKGTGLGLAICKGIIELHQGRIWVEDQAGGGAKFTFTLPLDPGYNKL